MLSRHSRREGVLCSIQGIKLTARKLGFVQNLTFGFMNGSLPTRMSAKTFQLPSTQELKAAFRQPHLELVAKLNFYTQKILKCVGVAAY